MKLNRFARFELYRVVLAVTLALGIAACSPSPTATPPAPTNPAAPQGSGVEPTMAFTPTAVLPPPLTVAATSTPLAIPTTTATSLPPTNLPPTATLTPLPTPLPATSTPVPTLPPPTNPPPTAANTEAPAPPTVAPPTNPPAAPPAQFQATELMQIPEGVLRMGFATNEDGPADAQPQHDVHMGPFAIERFEVTNAQYAACVQAGACTPVGAPLNGDNFPVVNVTWNQANAYCTWIGRRLPNEAEWERAARGLDNWTYTWSNRPAPHFEWNAQYHGSPLSFCDASCAAPHFIDDVNDGFPTTAPVGAFGSLEPRKDISKEFNVEDMNGNVSEWVSNWYDGTAYQQGYPIDVQGPANATGAKAYRGGSWRTEPLRLATRLSLPPDQSKDDLGFRCAQ